MTILNRFEYAPVSVILQCLSLSIACFCVLRPTPAPAAGPVDCKQLMLHACEQLNPAQSTNLVAHLQFTSRTVFRTPGEKKPRTTLTPANLYVQGKKLYFKTPQTILWQDGRYIAAVMHSQKVIYITRMPPVGANQASLSQFGLLRDSLIIRGKITNCQTIKLADKSGQKIDLALAAKDQARYRASAIGFKLDAQLNIREFTVFHSPNAAVVQTVYSIEKREFITASTNLPDNARDKVLDRQNHPLAAYAGYQVVDHTKLNHIAY